MCLGDAEPNFLSFAMSANRQAEAERQGQSKYAMRLYDFARRLRVISRESNAAHLEKVQGKAKQKSLHSFFGRTTSIAGARQ